MARRAKKLSDRRQVDPAVVIAALGDHEVDYIVIGGFAAIVHGARRLTHDLDIIIDRRLANCRRLIATLAALGAEHRVSSGRWAKLSANADPKWIAAENRFFDTTAGGVDVWNRMRGVPSWKEARPRAIEAEAFGHTVPVLDKDSLIASKLAAGRDKDLGDVADLG
ncbi:MAG: hypothetical protein ACRDKH_00825 [Solirubrobacterales bacterium]